MFKATPSLSGAATLSMLMVMCGVITGCGGDSSASEIGSSSAISALSPVPNTATAESSAGSTTAATPVVTTAVVAPTAVATSTPVTATTSITTAQTKAAPTTASASSSTSSPSTASVLAASTSSTSPSYQAPDYTGHLPIATVYVNGSPQSGTNFVNGVYQTAWKSSTGVSITDFGAVGDGKTDNSIAFRRALAASNTVLVPSGDFVLASPIAIGSNKSLIGVGSNSVVRPRIAYGFVIQGTNVVIQNIHFIGPLSSIQQYVEDQHFSSALTKSALKDVNLQLVPVSTANSSTPDQNTLSLTAYGTPGSVTGPFYLSLAMTGLQPSARYYLHSSQNFISGTGSMLPTFFVNGTTSYAPGNASNDPYFTGASSLDIQLGVARRWTDMPTVTATFDLAALSLLRATNEMAVINTTTVEENTYVYVENSTNVYFLNNIFELFDSAALKLNDSQHVYIVGNTVKQSFGGITTQSGQNNFFVNNSIDNRFSDEAGVMLNHSFIRSHGISLSTTPYSSLRENNDQIVANNILGASWGIESPGSILYPNVSLNIIKAGQVGISIANEFGFISRNTIALDGVSSMGIEIPTDGINASHDVTIIGNSVDMSASSLYDVGLAVSNQGGPGADLYNFQVMDNVIVAPIGFQFLKVRPNAESSIVLTNNQVTHLGLPGFIQPESGAYFELSTDAAVKNNLFSCNGSIKFWGIDAAVPVVSCP